MGGRSLAELAPVAGGTLIGGDAVVDDVTDDSRKVRPGCLFAAVEGTRTDGHRFVGEAVARGAAGLLVHHALEAPVPQIVVPFVRPSVGRVAAAVHDRPSERMKVVGVTGTNGKTTTTMLVASILRAADWPHGLLGTVEVRFGDRRAPSAMTTPPAPELQRTLGAMARSGARAVAMEVSSHALDRGRVEGTRFEVGVYLNLTPEHLDYHGTVEHYWASKAALLDPGRCRHGIVCVDDHWGRRLAHQASIPVTTFGTAADASVRYRPERSDLSGTVVAVEVEGRQVSLGAPRLVGPWNAPNMVAAYLTARRLGITEDDVRAGLEAFEGVPGRCEAIDLGQGFLVLVDYAHTPEAVEGLARFGRHLAGPGGRTFMVVGATGERDRLKRPGIGAAAALCDVAVLTSDSPAGEDPMMIIDQVRLGALSGRASQVVLEPDRARAIERALSGARPGDVVLVAGRGHETSQLLGSTRVPLDDRKVVHDVLARLHFDVPAAERPSVASGTAENNGQRLAGALPNS